MKFKRFFPFSNDTLALLVGFTLMGYVCSTGAAPGREDIDVDDDGLIEIVDVDDFVYAITEGFVDSIVATYESSSEHNIKVLYEQTQGCPESGCFGYELANDIDLQDITSSGLTGNKALAIFQSSTFTGVLEGNGKRILNYQNPMEYAGFAMIRSGINATVRNLIMTGPETQVGGFTLGESGGGSMLFAYADNVLVHDCIFEGDVGVYAYGSAIAYSAHNSYILNNRIRFTFSGNFIAGIATSIASSRVMGNEVTMIGEGQSHGLAYQSLDEQSNVFAGNRIELQANSASTFYPFTSWGDPRLQYNYAVVTGDPAVEVEFASSEALSSLAKNYVPQGYIDSATPITADAEEFPEILDGCVLSPSMICNGSVWFVDWDQLQDDIGASVWAFTPSEKMPRVRDGLLFADSDDDQVPDQFDDFPWNRAAAIDTDKDGAPDTWRDSCSNACRDQSGLHLDQFPEQFAASRDDNKNGQPDAWHPDCDQACQLESGLQLDASSTAGALSFWMLLILGVLYRVGKGFEFYVKARIAGSVLKRDP